MFDIREFFENLKDNPEKKEIYEKYNKYVQDVKEITTYKDLKVYKDYLEKFDVDIFVENLFFPEFVDEDIDYDLLLKLIFGSFSSKWDIICDIQNSKIKIFVIVSAGDKKVKKYLDDLWGFQIIRMFEIYLEEQMNLFILKDEYENEREIILKQQKENLKYFENVTKRLKKFLTYIRLKENNE